MLNETMTPLLKRINNKVNNDEWTQSYWEDAQRALMQEFQLGDFPTYELTTGDIINANNKK